ncbi:uncharacterized protein TRUGW13939_09046 [Talaromyces rugulosus]|uniref:Uncharacterized protein n=1 Tax=Talaromyces rugulosus TaxID=121627 RepID=A0A7H8R691_TALRU|nr:uncharacterized protein TRUGW13939_09046 [Talaromyces rugulosus]QKX61890.1 hypothetical protein TRUGW13939_09046 [Talaromyces rugulosus]
MDSHFTFLTSTNPALGEADIKQMRAHVTRKNFEKRRERLEGTISRSNKARRTRHRQPEQPSDKLRLARKDKSPSPDGSEKQFRVTVSPYTLISTEANYASIYQFYRSFRPLLLTLAADQATLIREWSWMQLNYAEPALLEASLALVAFHDSLTGSGSVGDVEMHQVKAVKIINSRLNNPATAVTDGVLAAVLTLAHCERLAKREIGYETHMIGFRHMLQVRKQQHNNFDGISWFSHLILSDTTEDIAILPKPSMNISHLFLPKTVPETIDSISQDLSSLRTAIEYSMRYDTAEEFVAREIDQRILEILNNADILRSYPAYISSLGLCIRIFLHLSSDRFPISAADLSVLTSELKAILGESDTRLCTSFELTAWQILTASVATTADSPAGRWFRITLWKVSRAFVLSDWSRVLAYLDKAFIPHTRLLAEFKAVWTEVMENPVFHI